MVTSQVLQPTRVTALFTFFRFHPPTDLYHLVKADKGKRLLLCTSGPQVGLCTKHPEGRIDLRAFLFIIHALSPVIKDLGLFNDKSCMHNKIINVKVGNKEVGTNDPK